MPLTSQLSLSVELTRLLPYQTVANAIGSGILSVARELQKSGSDAVVEEDLATLFGRAQLEARFCSSFRGIVARHSSKPLIEVVDLFLDGGAGPTVQRCLRKGADQAYLSAVAQLSLLLSVFDIHSLTRGLRQALTHRAEQLSPGIPSVPAYDTLLGTLRAIQDQTSAYDWRLLLDAARSKIFSAWNMHHCHLPVAILQGCLDMLAIVQRFPDDRIVQIKCTAGSPRLIELLVVWTHHVLGLDVVVCDPSRHAYAKFGAGPENVIVVFKKDNYTEAEISLLDGSREDLFRIAEDPDDPEIDGELRAKGRGFGNTYLRFKRYPPRYWRRAVQNATQTCRSWFSTECYSSVDEAYDLGQHRLTCAAEFLFPDVPSVQSDEDNAAAEVEPLSAWDKDIETQISQLLFTFACCFNFDELHNLPLAVEAAQDLPKHPPESLRQPFENMKRLLLGAAEVSNAVLVSSHGWSLFTNVLVLPDPSKISLPLFHVAYGVPSRGGERKRQIVDGFISENDAITRPPEREQLVTEPRLICEFDIPKPRWYVGTTSQAFEILISFDLEPYSMNVTGRRAHCLRILRAGLLELESCAIRARRLLPCQHEDAALGGKMSTPDDCRFFSSECDLALEKDDDPRWIFVALSAGSSQARWFCLLSAKIEATMETFNPGGKREIRTYLRDKGTCFGCGTDIIRQEMGPREQPGPEPMKIGVLVL